MKLAVMQPYLFPYIGYFQLISAADVFVLYDDVAFIKQGYINRNHILANGESKRFTLPVPGASSNKKIKELSFSRDVRKPLAMIRQSYSKAPFFDDVYPLIERALMNDDRSIVAVCRVAIESILSYLAVGSRLYVSSDLVYRRDAPAQARLIELCQKFDADCYINSIGGKALYAKPDFLEHAVELKFLQPKNINYNQGEGDFIANLSIIDILMHCEKVEVRELLKTYELC